MRAFDDRLFHDCILEAIDLSHWKDEVTLRVLCPVRARGRDAARHRTLVFKRVLCFAFETAVIGEFGNDGPEVSIYMDADSAERKAWIDRIGEMGAPSASYPHGIRSPDYHDVYHFVLHSVWFEGLACLPKERGFQVICRDFEVRD